MNHYFSAFLFLVDEEHFIDGSAHIKLREEGFLVLFEDEVALDLAPVELTEPIFRVVDEDKGIATKLIIFPLADKDLSIIGDKDTLAMFFDSFGVALVNSVSVLEYLGGHDK